MRFAPKIMLKTQKLAEIAQIEVLTKMDFFDFSAKMAWKSRKFEGKKHFGQNFNLSYLSEFLSFSMILGAKRIYNA